MDRAMGGPYPSFISVPTPPPPRGLGTKLRMPDRYYGLSVHPHPAAIQDPTGRREGRVGRKCWALDPEKGWGWAERICFQA